MDDVFCHQINHPWELKHRNSLLFLDLPSTRSSELMTRTFVEQTEVWEQGPSNGVSRAKSLRSGDACNSCMDSILQLTLQASFPQRIVNFLTGCRSPAYSISELRSYSSAEGCQVDGYPACAQTSVIGPPLVPPDNQRGARGEGGDHGVPAGHLNALPPFDYMKSLSHRC